MTIGQISRRAGVRPSTIRYYERLGLLPSPIRQSGQRRYDETVLQRLAIIRFAKHVGFSLIDIGQLLVGTSVRPPTDRWRRMAHAKLHDLEAAIQHAIVLKQLLAETIGQTCPKLVERGTALRNASVRPEAITDLPDGRTHAPIRRREHHG
jgi:MerR family redox-sensitive transcriptional activator SoxR